MLVRAGLLGLLVVGAAALFARRATFLYRLIRLGRRVDRSGDLPERVAREGTVVFGQRKLLQRVAPGLMHAFIFWGFLVLLTTIAEALGQAIDPGFALPLIGRSGWLGLLQDVFAALVVVGIAMALWIRKVERPERFVGSHLQEADLILVWIFGIVLTLIGANAVRIAGGIAEAPEAWTPVSNAAAGLFRPMGDAALATFEDVLVWLHLVLVFGFLVYIPYSKHLHIVTSFVNVFLASTKPRGYLTPLRIDLESADPDISLGAATVTDLTTKELLDLYACTECGRCQAACPAWNTGKPLSPKLLIMNLRDHLFERGPQLLSARDEVAAAPGGAPLVPDVVDPEVVWSCTTCGACMRECPVEIEHVDHIVDLRRNLVMAESSFPSEAGTLFRNLESRSNPWGRPQAERAAWADGLGVDVLSDDETAPEYLFWVGCAASFDERATKVSRSMAALLQAAGVRFAILGARELCTGDPARRMGNEYLFQTLAEQNVHTLGAAGVTKIVASCPHCFNTIANEYPDYGGRFDVVHHTELLAELLESGRLRPTRELSTLLAYHDPCYLGRHNGVYDPPRAALAAIPGVRLTDMPRHRERAFCCGAGGSRMWMEERIGKRVSGERMDEAAATGAGTVGVACPYCLVMLDDEAKGRSDGRVVEDVAQTLARSVLPPDG